MEMEVETKTQVEEIMVGAAMEMVEGSKNGGGAHPYAFHVSGPRNLSSPNWRDIINSSWFVCLFSIAFIYKFLYEKWFHEMRLMHG